MGLHATFPDVEGQQSRKRGIKGMAQIELGRLIDVAEAATVLGVAPKTIRTWIHLRKISYVQIGRDYRIKEETLREMIEQNSVIARER
jgi:excisionase family DNA binding protein